MSKVCISAGHNPSRQGAEFEGLTEYEEACRWAELIVSQLSNYLTVDYVPTGPLKEKVKFINAAKAELAIEIHFNSAVNSKGERVGKGSETLHYPGSKKGREAALIMQSHLSKVFHPDRGAKDGWYQMNRDKGPDYFLKATDCLALIVEPDFIHRSSSIQQFREEGCHAICDAIFKILSQEVL